MNDAFNTVARSMEEAEARKEIRNGALLALGFLLVPILLASIIPGSVGVFAVFPILFGVIMVGRGMLSLARLRAQN